MTIKRYIQLPNSNGNFEVRFFKKIQAKIFDKITNVISEYDLDLNKKGLLQLCQLIYDMTNNR